MSRHASLAVTQRRNVLSADVQLLDGERKRVGQRIVVECELGIAQRQLAHTQVERLGRRRLLGSRFGGGRFGIGLGLNLFLIRSADGKKPREVAAVLV